MLGTALQRVLTASDPGCFSAPDEAHLDITDVRQVEASLGEFVRTVPDGGRGVVVNAAAYTNVERAEEDAEKAYLVNETGARLLARAAREAGLGFVHVSTDFVFDGEKSGPYVETDEPNPLSVYGASKLAGEFAVAEENPQALVVRTVWVFGPRGANFPTKILQVARERGRVTVVTDEVGSPTYTPDLATGILGLVAAGATGLFHLAGSGTCSRYEMAVETLRLAGLGEVPVDPVTSDTFPTKAARPRNSVLDCSKARRLGVEMPPWTDALARFLLHDVTD